MSKTEDLQIEVLSNLPHDVIKIVGKHSKHWNYSKLETLELLGEYIDKLKQDTYAEARKSLESEVYNHMYREMADELQRLSHPSIRVVRKAIRAFFVEQIVDVNYVAPGVIEVIIANQSTKQK